MINRRKDVKLYNVFFPVWMLFLVPQVWLAVFPINFLVDSLILLAGLSAWKIADKKLWYKRHIFKIFCFGLLADFIAAGFLLLMLVLEIGQTGDDIFLTAPATLLAGLLIYIFNCRFTFKTAEQPLRRKLSLLFAIATAPYTFLIPVTWIY